MKLKFWGWTGIVASLSASALAATPPPNESGVVDTSILDMGVSPEERMVSDGLPATPESGAENAEDLLRSAPSLPGRGRNSNSASARGARDGMPSTLPELPPLPPPVEETAAAPFETSEISDSAPSDMENVVVPDEPESSIAVESSGSSSQGVDRKIPPTERENPHWGIDVHGSVQALGTPIRSQGLDITGNPVGPVLDNTVSNFGFGFEYQPEFLQSIGVVSFGPSFNMYVLSTDGALTESAFSIISFGGSLKYQLRFVRGQVVVPFVGYEMQQLRYSFREATIGQGWTMASGLTFGALIYLNWIEPSAAHTFWAETGIKRSYLIAEMKQLTAEEPLLSTDGTALYFGIRMEY